MREKTIEQKLVSETKKRGGLAWKFVSPGIAGVPDRIVLMPGGHIAFVETKAPGGKPRPVQNLRHKQIRRLGFRVFVLDDTADIARVLDEIGGEEHGTYDRTD